MKNNLSENLKKIRKDNNLSQEQLAEELGVSRQAISKWESGTAYPEMDKIIQLCNRFELYIDDLLNKDIREVKENEISKNNLNKIIDSFLNFVTDTINLFHSMSFKNKIKCIFEQVFIIIILFILSKVLGYVLMSTFGGILTHFPDGVHYFIVDILNAIYILFCIIVSVGIIVHVFKTRYLDYYLKIKSETLREEPSDLKEKAEHNKDSEDSKILFRSNENKIIIRDPKNSEYRFVHSIFKIFIFGVKCFALIILGLLCSGLIGLLACFVASFIISKTGIFFVGIFLSILSTATLDIVIIILLLNFIFNRKNDKPKMIWTFIISLIVLGVSIGLIFIGSLKFDYVTIDSNSKDIKTNKIVVDFKDNLFIVDDHFDYEIEYIEKNIDNIEIDIRTNKLVDVKSHIYRNGEISFLYDSSAKKVFDNFISNLNKYKIVEVNNEVYSFKVYASKENINKLKENYNIYKKSLEEVQN